MTKNQCLISNKGCQISHRYGCLIDMFGHIVGMVIKCRCINQTKFGKSFHEWSSLALYEIFNHIFVSDKPLLYL